MYANFVIFFLVFVIAIYRAIFNNNFNDSEIRIKLCDFWYPTCAHTLNIFDNFAYSYWVILILILSHTLSSQSCEPISFPVSPANPADTYSALTYRVSPASPLDTYPALSFLVSPASPADAYSALTYRVSPVSPVGAFSSLTYMLSTTRNPPRDVFTFELLPFPLIYRNIYHFLGIYCICASTRYDCRNSKHIFFGQRYVYA